MDHDDISAEDLDALLDSVSSASDPQTVASKSSETSPDFFQLTPMQQRLFTQHKLSREGGKGSSGDRNGAYNIFGAFRLAGNIDFARLVDAIDRVASRHQILKAIFVEDPSGDPVQQICPQASNHSSIIDVTADDIPVLIDQERCRKFDLDDGPPWHITIARLTPETTILLVCFYHILIDGHAISVIIGDLAKAYNGISLPPVKEGFLDYISKKRLNENTAQVLQRAIKRLDGTARLELPKDNFKEPPSGGWELPLIIGKERSQRLDQACLDYQCSPFAVLGTAFSIALHVFSGQEDFVLGASIVDRNDPVLEDMVGLLVNMALIRCQLSEHETLADILRKFVPASLAAMDDVHINPRDVLRKLQIRPEDSGDELFSAVLTYFRTNPKDLPALSGIEIEKLASQTTSRFDLELFLSLGHEGYEGSFIPNPKRLGETTVQSISAYFITVIDALIQDGAQRIGELGTEPTLLLAKPFSSDTGICVHERILAMCRTFKDSIAVSVPTIPSVLVPETTALLTYGDLDGWSSRIAAALLDGGMKPGDLVGLSCFRDSALPAAILGVLRAGGAYVPLDPEYPEKRINMMVSDAAVKTCIVSDNSVMVPEGCTAINAADLRTGVYQTRPAPRITDESLAYVIFTSGSTGRPKGVKVTHRNLCRLFDSTASWFGFSDQDAWAMCHSYAFDFSVWEIFGALLHGGRLVILSNDIRRDPDHVSDIVINEEITFLSQTPTAFSLNAAKLAEKLTALRPIMRKLRHIVFGGEALSVGMLEKWFSKHGDTNPQLTNMYGITETTVHVTYRPISREDLKQATRSPIGIPIPDLKLLLINTLGQEVPRGAPGEILVIGDGVSAGYLNRPRLTEQRFIASTEDGDLLAYRSGDFARYDQDGELVFIGRTDKQVKVRGHRIELGEVQHALEQVPGVEAAVVLPKADSNGEDQLIAYVIPNPQEDKHARIVREWQHTFDQYYDDTIFILDDPDFTGWHNSYDGANIPKHEMQAWLDETITRIQSIGAKNVLEIGCGSGMLLGGLAPSVDHYCALDISGSAIAALQRGVAAVGWDNIRLYEMAATEIEKHSDELLINGQFDLVIINSVVQYFPSSAYLDDVLTKATALIAPGGQIFLGDIRASASRNILALSRRIYAPNDARIGIDFSWKDCSDEGALDPELMFDPGRVMAPLAKRSPCLWPRLKYFEPLNELSKFRYDLLIQLDRSPQIINLDEIQIGTSLDLNLLGNIFLKSPKTSFIIRGILNARLDEERAHTLLVTGNSRHGAIVDPAALDSLAESCNRSAATFWSSVENNRIDGHGCFDIFITAAGGEETAFLPSGCIVSEQVHEPDVKDAHTESSDGLQDHGSEWQGSIRHALASMVPAHMLPDHIIAIQHFPLTLVGKLNTAALPTPADAISLQRIERRDKAANNENGSAHKPEIREEIAALIGDLLKCSQPTLDENFFEIGGHSLKAVRLANLIQDKFGVGGCLPVIFNSPTLNQIASFVEDNLPESLDKDDKQNSATAPSRSQATLKAVLATRAQARFFLLHQLNPSNAYNVSTVLKLTGSLELQCLQAAFYATMRRHEGLRTQFDLEGDRVVQIVKDDEKPFLDFQIVEVPGISESELKKKLAYEASCVFDLTAPPAVKVRAFRTEPNVTVIGINTHHVRIDGDSLRILTGDLSHFYNCAVCDVPATLAPVFQPSDLASWEAEQAELDIDKLEKFWREHLEDAPPPVVFVPQLGKQGAASYELKISGETWRAAKQIAKPYNMGPYPVLIGAYALALGQLTGRNDIVIGNVVSQRTRAEMQNIVAPLLNTLPIRLKLPERQSSEGYLHHVRKVLLETREHGRLQLDEIVEKVTQDRQQSNGDIFQALIAWQAFERTEATLGSLKSESVFLPETDVKADFSILLTEFGDDDEQWLGARFTVDAKKMPPSTAENLAQNFENFLEMLVKGETLNIVAAAESYTQNNSFSTLSSYAPNSTNQVTPALIEQVRACWARLLGVPGLRVSDDIFLHGAHSLKVLRLAKETGKILGWKLPPGIIFNTRTCQGTLSSAVPGRQHDQLLAPLSTLTGLPSIFLFPDISGQLFSQRFLANELSSSFDVWGIQFSVDLDLPDNFEALATRIANALISVDSQEPYHLIGYSFGVQLMAHTAAILEAEGHAAVHSLIALDALPQAPGQALPELTDEVRRWTVFADVIALNQFNTEANIDEHALRLMNHQERVDFIAEVLSSLSDGQLLNDAEIVSDLWNTFSYLSQLILPAMPPINNGVALIASEAGGIGGKGLTEWQAVCPQPSHYVCGGDHHSMLSAPHVRQVADIILKICQAGAINSGAASSSQEIIARLPDGFRDISSQEMSERRRTIDRLTDFINLHGYMPMETPVVEFLDSLGMYLPDIDAHMGQVFAVRDADQEWIGLRYDMTTSLVRHVIQNCDTLSFPVKRQTVGAVFRNEGQSSGKLRQFQQLDVDYVGAISPVAEAEICLMLRDALACVGLPSNSICIYLNDRRILDIFLDHAGISDQETRQSVLAIMDFQDNLSSEEIILRLGDREREEPGSPVMGLGLNQDQIDTVVSLLTSPAIPFDGRSLRWIETQVADHPDGAQVLECFSWLIAALQDPEGRHISFKFDPKVIRGLSYYSGLIFEVRPTDPALIEIGSIAGGGRYDRLFERYNRRDLSAIGFSIGIDRIVTLLQAYQTPATPGSGPCVEIVTSTRQQKSAREVYALASRLHSEGIPCILTDRPVNAEPPDKNHTPLPFSHRIEPRDNDQWKVQNLKDNRCTIVDTTLVISAILD